MATPGAGGSRPTDSELDDAVRAGLDPAVMLALWPALLAAARDRNRLEIAVADLTERLAHEVSRVLLLAAEVARPPGGRRGCPEAGGPGGRVHRPQRRLVPGPRRVHLPGMQVGPSTRLRGTEQLCLDGYLTPGTRGGLYLRIEHHGKLYYLGPLREDLP